MEAKLGLEESLERADGLKPMMAHVSTMTDDLEDVAVVPSTSPPITANVLATVPSLPAALLQSRHSMSSSRTPVPTESMYHSESGQFVDSSRWREESESHWPELATAGGAGGSQITTTSDDGRYDYSQYPWVYDYSTGEWQDWSQSAAQEA